MEAQYGNLEKRNIWTCLVTLKETESRKKKYVSWRYSNKGQNLLKDPGCGEKKEDNRSVRKHPQGDLEYEYTKVGLFTLYFGVEKRRKGGKGEQSVDHKTKIKDNTDYYMGKRFGGVDLHFLDRRKDNLKESWTIYDLTDKVDSRGKVQWEQLKEDSITLCNLEGRLWRKNKVTRVSVDGR